MSDEDIVRHLIEQATTRFRRQEHEQTATWRETVASLRHALKDYMDRPNELQGILIEFPLNRIGKRIDIIVLRQNVCIVVEVKGGQGSGMSGAVGQVEDYALGLKAFHGPSRDMTLLPVAASGKSAEVDFKRLAGSHHTVDGVANTLVVSLTDLPWVLQLARRFVSRQGPTLEQYDCGEYRPTVNIIDAARQAYASNSVDEFRLAGADAEHLQAADTRLRQVATQAERNQTHTICFVLGDPGAGKTLLGLDLVLVGAKKLAQSQPAAFLSGNRPLVAVLRAALAADYRTANGVKAKEAQRVVRSSVQMMLDFIREHGSTEAALPPERIIVFDEAQRAWDAATGKKIFDREESEPAIFLDIMRRHSWGLLVCLVGSGQEINRGESGLRLWFDALADQRRQGTNWRVVAPARRALELLHVPADRRSPSVANQESDGLVAGGVRIHDAPELWLRNSVRTYKNAEFTTWLDCLLDGQLDEARRIAAKCESPLAYVTRSLDETKRWLVARRRGSQRVGLVASSGAVRLRALGIQPSPLSKDLSAIEHWFLRGSEDFRSSNALEVPLSEYSIQGLEVDYVGLCWGGDLVWNGQNWEGRQMRAPKWGVIRDSERKRFKLNSYRVLLSRHRSDVVIFVPRGSANDPTREPKLFDATAEALKTAGAIPL